MKTRVIIRQINFPVSEKNVLRNHFTIRLPPDVEEVIAVDATARVEETGARHLEAARLRLQAAGKLLCDLPVRCEGTNAVFTRQAGPQMFLDAYNFVSGIKRRRLEISLPGSAGVITGYALNYTEIDPAYSIKIYLYYRAKEKTG